MKKSHISNINDRILTFLFVIVVIAAVITVIKAEPTEQIEYEHIDKSMPRSHSVFSMETGDAEYFEWERGRLNR